MVNYQESWSPYLKALYWDKKGDWEKAHDIVQDLESPEASWIHAYLHRKEGDEWNAGYWYRRAGKSIYTGPLDQEWEELWKHFNP
ncbi:hypothetical protein [Cesiribacter sp. SM1]|uniref:hypothetical protein n=1 Tax=Cesiribacter sp. SM1 TaxID=2861196 RepID=UPI001CD26F98|nr:hypothetical protein [Cesiribacter sp. SM1]